MKEINPYVESNIFRSVENVNLSTIIAYKDADGKHRFTDHYDDADRGNRERKTRGIHNETIGCENQ